MSRILHGLDASGYVEWELTDIETGTIAKSGKHNLLVNKAREQLADFMKGTSITAPQYVAIGTGTNTPSASDTALQTLVQYDGAHNAKVADSRTIRSLYTARIIVQFLTGEANQTIRELGLFEEAAATTMWARVAVNIAKTSSQRLTVYWYITFERSVDMALKTGASIGATGTLVAGGKATLTFASTVTVIMIHNNSGEELTFKINEDLDAATPPVDFDFMLQDNEVFVLLNEEIAVNTVAVYCPSVSGAMPNVVLSCVGW
tara:strand:- start:883 stop:1665 length:783 start_codon:yes stop_codon:yes gene_type:complete